MCGRDRNGLAGVPFCWMLPPLVSCAPGPRSVFLRAPIPRLPFVHSRPFAMVCEIKIVFPTSGKPTLTRDRAVCEATGARMQSRERCRRVARRPSRCLHAAEGGGRRFAHICSGLSEHLIILVQIALHALNFARLLSRKHLDGILLIHLCPAHPCFPRDPRFFLHSRTFPQGSPLQVSASLFGPGLHWDIALFQASICRSKKIKRCWCS